ncbi:hypothetical protein HPB48_008872 [Haemaphysalis longicornis]|uniref:Uncharacterized protein n=1 Tax=Haemaphysalis longicornis TaxID=44386 RepID=A0A9J6GZ80_HAELO|nr:hypothetical protein HPB48_008872 [Haemaphysalis longicornis]
MLRLWHNGPANRLNSVTRSGLYVVVYSQALLSFLNMALRRAQLADIARGAAEVERRLRVDPRRVRRRLRKVSLWCLAYCVVDALKLFVGVGINGVSEVFSQAGLSEPVKWLFLPSHFASCVIIAAWYNMAFWQIAYFSSTLAQYFSALSDSLEDGLRPSQSSWTVTDERVRAATEEARANLVELQKLVNKVDVFVGIQGLWYYAGSVFFLCATLYTVVISDTSTADIVLRLSHVAIMAAGIVLSTEASGRMSGEVRGCAGICVDALRFRWPQACHSQMN